MMASCFGKRRSYPESSSSEIVVSVYPPPIIIQRYWVIPEFIREGRQLSRTLSLNLEVEDSISTSYSESSFDNRFGSVFSRNEVPVAGLSLKSGHLDWDSDSNKNQSGDPSQRSGAALECREITSSNHSISDLRDEANEAASQIFKSKLPVAPAYNPVNIKPREIKKVESRDQEETNSFKKRQETTKTAKNQLEDLCFNDYIASNDYIEKYLTREKSIEEKSPIQSTLGSDPAETVLEEPALYVAKETTKPLPEEQVPSQRVDITGKKSLAGRRRILSAPNEPIAHLEQAIESQRARDARSRHRTSSLRVLAQTVISLMNKRGSRGREERQEARAISQLIKEMNIPGSNSSESCLSKSQHSSAGSNSPVYLKSSSVNDLVKKLSGSKKQVSFEMDLKVHERKRSPRLSKRFSGLLGRRKSSRSDSKVEFNRKSSNVSVDYPNQAECDGSNTILLESEVFKMSQGGVFGEIKEFNVPISLTKSSSSETLQSNFSLDQRVARTYDMQILTYDQTPIPIPNLPRGRKLQSLENLENCYLVIRPNISSMLSLCNCTQH